MQIEVFPQELPGSEHYAEHARRAAQNVGLVDRVAQLTLALDAPEFDGSGFWQIEDAGHGAIGATLYGSPADVLALDSRVRVFEIARLDAATIARTPGVSFDPLRLDRWLHRNLLQLDDILRDRVCAAKIRRDDAPGMQACWDVWTDGRLRTWQHPGLSQAERRRAFYRIFAHRGMLMPKHWAVFHELWDGHLNGHEGLTEAVGRLPRA